MLIAHEAPGLLEHSKRVALKLADIGYVAFALDYLGNGRVLTTMPEVADTSRNGLPNRRRCD